MQQSAVGLHAHHRGHHRHQQHANLHPMMMNDNQGGHLGSRHPPGHQPPTHHRHPPGHHQPRGGHRQAPQHHHPPGHHPPRPAYMNRPTEDPHHYDQMFHNQTRPERRIEHVQGNQRFQDYHLFAPKFMNHQDSSGYGDTWAAPRHQDHRQTLGEEDRLPTKRGQRVPFPARTAPFVPTGSRPRAPSNVTHSLEERQLTGFGRNNRAEYVSPYQTNGQQIDRFNQVIDSMHLPEDMQRPLATRDMMKDMSLEEESSQAKRNDDYIADRQMDMLTREGMFTIGGSFEDMFY